MVFYIFTQQSVIFYDIFHEKALIKENVFSERCYAEETSDFVEITTL